MIEALLHHSGVRIFQVVESPSIPPLGLFLGSMAMVPFIVGAAAAWMLSGLDAAASVSLSIIWASSILAFLAGVRRGLSFRALHTNSVGALATMFAIFLLALAALITAGQPVWLLSALLIGYALVAVLDPIAARSGDTPCFFARLRPPQMIVPITSLIALLWRVLA